MRRLAQGKEIHLKRSPRKRSIVIQGLILFMTALMPIAAHANPVRLSRITEMFENSEAGFAYLKHCGDFDKTIKEQPFFMANAQVVVAALAQELKVEHPELTTERTKDAILTRSAQIQSAFDKSYEDPKACSSPAADAARKLIEISSKTTPEATASFLQNIENR
jgi:hypothetical protein